MVLKIFCIFVLLLILFVLYVALLPAAYTIFREITISASAEKIFPFINDAKKMNEWNPWMELDPNVKITFSGNEVGVGAVTSWEGGSKLGTGSATVIESVPNTLVKTRLDYSKPFAMTQTAELSLYSVNNQTVVRWTVSGSNTFVCRAVGIFMNMDKMIGGTFENGLSKLKKILESTA